MAKELTTCNPTSDIWESPPPMIISSAQIGLPFQPPLLIYDAQRINSISLLYFRYTWLHSVAFSTPFLTEVVTSEFRSQLHICAVTGDTSVVFVYATLIVCFLVPLVAIIVFQILIVKATGKLKIHKRAEVAQKTYTQVLGEHGRIGHRDSESHPSTYTRILLLLWLVLVLPFVITSSIKHYEYSQSQEESLLEYPWAVDATFIWLKFFFVALFPVITFCCKNDLWQTSKEFVLCRKNNSITDMEDTSLDFEARNVNSETYPKDEVEFSTPKSREIVKTEISKADLAFNIPVLFATSTGICVEDNSVDNARECEMLPYNDQILAVELKGKQLDISYYGQDWHDEVVGDTSDYDSSVDVECSPSQIISARHVRGSFQRPRSSSQSHIVETTETVFQTKHVKNSSCGADSGLDLLTSSTMDSANINVPTANITDNPAMDLKAECFTVNWKIQNSERNGLHVVTMNNPDEKRQHQTNTPDKDWDCMDKQNRSDNDNFIIPATAHRSRNAARKVEKLKRRRLKPKAIRSSGPAVTKNR